jgi:hypothetical protein
MALLVFAVGVTALFGKTTPVITWTNPAAITYGTALGTNQLNATAEVSGTFIYTNPPAGTILAVGSNHLLSVTFVPADTSLYDEATTNVTLTVTPFALTVSADSVSRPYGATNPPLTGTLTGVQNGDHLTTTFHTAADTNSPVGAYPITPIFDDPDSKLGNYSVLTNLGTLTVEPAVLTVTASAQSKTYGQTVTFDSGSTAFTSSGLQNGETIGSVTLAVSGSGGAASAPVSGSPYTITPSAATGGTFSADNYTITYNPGTLTVNAASTATGVTTSGSPKLPSDSVTFTATVNAGGPVPTGTVQFKSNGSNLGSSVALDGSGVVQITITASTAGHGSLTITAVYVNSDGNFNGSTGTLSPNQVINTPPVALADIIPRVPPYGTRVPVSVLLTNDSDADGDAVVFDTVNATSTAGGRLSLAGDWIFYTPPAGFTNDDSFTYTVRDGLGGFATGTVAVTNLVDRGTSARLTLIKLGNGTFRIVSAGVPWGIYTIEFTENLNNQNWVGLATGTADLWGRFVVDDTPPQGTRSRFYRAKGTILFLPLLIALSSSANPALPGSNVTFTVSLTNVPSVSNTPSGTVQFRIDGADYGSPVALAGGNAQFSTTNLSWGEHSVSAVYSGDGTFPSATWFLDLPQVINTPPVARDDVIQRDPNHGTKMLVSDLLANDSEADPGDPLVFDSISAPTAEGGTLNLAEGWIFYTPPAGFAGADSFTYRVRDSLGAAATATVEIVPRVGIEPSANLTLVDLGNGTYRIVFSGIPWRIYTIQYTESLEQPNWHSLATNTADSHGLFEYDDTWPPGTQSRVYRSISQSAGATASPFRLAAWTNFIGQTNGRTMDMWSERFPYPTGWPNVPPVLAWNTNCLLYGLDGFTGISQCNEFEGNPGQVPVTLLTRRHGCTRGHGFPGTNGLCTTLLAGQRVWFCAADNTVVQMTVAAEMDRLGDVGGNSYDYGLVVFTEDVPESISPVSVMSPADLEIYYWNTPDLPYLFLGTEQAGHVSAGVSPFVFDIMKGGDSGSPNMIPSPDNKLIMYSGRATSGFSPQMQADLDALSVYVGRSTNNYQLRWYDLSPWGP